MQGLLRNWTTLSPISPSECHTWISPAPQLTVFWPTEILIRCLLEQPHFLYWSSAVPKPEFPSVLKGWWMWRMWKPRPHFSSSSSFCNWHSFSIIKVSLKKSARLTVPESVWEFTLSSFKWNHWTWQGLPLLNGLSVSFSISKSFLFLTLGKNADKLCPTYTRAQDENGPPPCNSLSHCSANPTHTPLLVLGVQWGREEEVQQVWATHTRLLPQLILMHSSEE